MELKECMGAVEAMLFAHAEPVSAGRLAQALDMDEDTVERVLWALQDEYDRPARGLRLLRLEDKWQLATKNEWSEPVKKILDTRRNTPLSQAALEVLAIIAYNQPVTRSYVDTVRGVDSSYAVGSLLERGLIESKGRLDAPGRPMLYGTTADFLRCFGLSSIADLPGVSSDEAAELLAKIGRQVQIELGTDVNQITIDTDAPEDDGEKRPDPTAAAIGETKEED